jgi:hypothetical protein
MSLAIHTERYFLWRFEGRVGVSTLNRAEHVA